jgi:hypothetical protein
MKKYMAFLVVGILALLGSKLVMENFAPSSMTAMEATAYEYGGAILGAALAMTYLVRSVAAAG